MAFGTGRLGLGYTTAQGQTIDLTPFRQAAAAPAPPITGSAYTWPHPSGLFTVQIGADGTVGGFVGGALYDPTASELTKATASVVAETWVYSYISPDAYPNPKANPIAHAVTGNEAPDAYIASIALGYFAFNKGMVATGAGWTGTNVVQTTAVESTPTTVTANQPSVVAQYQGQITAAINAAQSAIAQLPLSTQILAAAVAALNLTGPGVPNLVSSLTPELEAQRQSALTQLAALLTQWTNTWNADLANIPSTDQAGQQMAADLASGQHAITAAIQSATSALQGSAVSLLSQNANATSVQGASPGTTSTISDTGGMTAATTTPTQATAVTNPDGSQTMTQTDGSTVTTAPDGSTVSTTPPIQTAGLSGTAALIGIAAIGLAILVGGSKKGKKR